MERRTSNQDGFAISPGSQAVALFAYSLASFFPAFMSSAVNIALPSINQEFHADAVVLSWLVTSFVLALAVLSLPFGRIADILGIKKIFVLGIIIFILASAAASFSNTIIMLILCRAAQSIGSAMIIGNSIALVTALYPANRRGRALGINLACVFIGMSLGPFLGGVLTQHLGWRSIFLINIPAGLLAIALILWKVKVEWSESKGEKFDIAGSIIYGLSLVALIYGFTLLPDLPGAVLIGAAVLGLFAFIRWENRTPSPILNLGLFRQNRTFVFSNLAGL
ncbi:MAG: putative transport protein, partial [Chloroflexi bacterium]|nr:putative transport protein [Chloroflexota bacterium]